MPRGLPDYGLLQTQTVLLDEGNINASVYQTGFSRLDGGGRVVLFEDFRSGLGRWVLSNTAPGAKPLIVSTDGVGAGFYPSAYFGVVGLNGVSQAILRNNMPVSGKIGVEFGYHLLASFAQFSLTFSFTYSASITRSALMRIETTTGKFQVYISGVWQTVYTPVSTTYITGRNYGVKMVFDTVNGIWDYMLINDKKIALGYNLGLNATVEIPGSYTASFAHYGLTAGNFGGAYLNYLVISADEP